jgi:hypothetical protein
MIYWVSQTEVDDTRGKKLHAVDSYYVDSPDLLLRKKSVCGISPLWGWGNDGNIKEHCSRCTLLLNNRGHME